MYFQRLTIPGTVQQVRELLEAAKFRLADMRDGDDGFEDSMKYYQKILIFNYNEREVL